MVVLTMAKPTYRSAPTFTSTRGDEAIDFCKEHEFVPYPEQELLLNDTFAYNGNRPAAFEVAGIATRQQLKTGWEKQVALTWAFVFAEPLVIWSAHEFSTAREAFYDLCTIIDTWEDLYEQVFKITTASGNEVIQLKNGSRIKFKARTQGGGRGLTAAKLILDEAYALAPEHMGALLPTLIAMENAQILYGSSAGRAGSKVLRALRDRGRLGNSARLAYTEWCAHEVACLNPQCEHAVGYPGCAYDNIELWREACIVTARKDPSMEAIRVLRESMPPEEFVRECLGWWEDASGDAVITPDVWRDGLDANSTIATRPIFALDVAPGHAWSALGVAGSSGGGRPHLEIPSRGGNLDHRPGTDWLLPRLFELREAFSGFKIHVVVGSPAAAFVPNFTKAGIQVEWVAAADVPPACGLLYSEATARHIAHLGQPDLDAAVSAGRKNQEEGETAWRWGRKKSDADITPLYAVTIALWVLASEPKEISMYSFDQLDLCDACGERPHEDPDGEHNYLCEECRDGE